MDGTRTRDWKISTHGRRFSRVEERPASAGRSLDGTKRLPDIHETTSGGTVGLCWLPVTALCVVLVVWHIYCNIGELMYKVGTQTHYQFRVLVVTYWQLHGYLNKSSSPPSRPPYAPRFDIELRYPPSPGLPTSQPKSEASSNLMTNSPESLAAVLLPPRTAQIYALLLKAELAELGKQRGASWERILDIRRLKDRMIRKCQRLAKAYSASNPGTYVSFLTIHAPPDFRVKEIEKWIRRQEGSDVLKKIIPPDMLRQRGSFCCDRCANLVPHHHTVSSRRSSVQTIHSRRSSISEKLPSKGTTLLRRPSTSASDMRGTNTRTPLPNASTVINENTIQRVRGQEIWAEEHISLRASDHFEKNATSHVASVVQERAQVRASKHNQSTSTDTSRFTSEGRLQETKRSMHTIAEDPHELGTDHSNRSCVESHSEVEPLDRLSIVSPDPLPVPYHGSTSAAFMEICDSPIDATCPETDKTLQRDSSAEDGTPSPPLEDEPTTDGLSMLDMPRRRSSLKRSNSELRMSMAYSTKTVSWAMDRDWAHQMTKYHAAAAQVEHADEEWGVISQRYQEELAGFKVLRRNVTQTLSKLRMETDKLQREDEVIRDQEEKLRQGYDQLEQKYGQYRAKVKAVLQETEQVLTLCGTKRDGEL
ncbi:hypothetical protein J3R82DRAFT_747 [Butyriboletus roseoflavus]|nr:hypothetical protein J3R82DRAFT_747 [Butyriboletus roseoflavus]